MITFNEFTEEKLAKAMGLKIGDKIMLKDSIDLESQNSNDRTQEKEIFVIKDYYLVVGLYNPNHVFDLKRLVELEFAILTEEDKIGDFDPHSNCTLDKKLTVLHHYKESSYENYFSNRKMPNTLFELLENWYVESKDKEIYDILKKRLDEPIVTK